VPNSKFIPAMFLKIYINCPRIHAFYFCNLDGTRIRNKNIYFKIGFNKFGGY